MVLLGTTSNSLLRRNFFAATVVGLKSAINFSPVSFVNANAIHLNVALWSFSTAGCTQTERRIVENGGNIAQKIGIKCERAAKLIMLMRMTRLQ